MRKIIVICVTSTLIVTLAGCSLKSIDNKPEKKKVKLVWCLPADKQYISDNEQKRVMKEVNREIEDLGIELQLNLYDVEDYESGITEKTASGDDWDLAFTSNWINDYVAGASSRYYAPLDNFLEETDSELYDSLPKYAWESLVVNGEIYAVPNKQCWAKAEGYYIREDLAQKYKFRCQTESLTPVSMLEQFFEDTAKEEHVYGTYADATSRWSRELITNGLTRLGNINTLGVIREKDELLTVVNQFETQEFKEYCYRMKFWNQEGYIRKDSAVYSMNSSAVEQDKKSGRIASEQLDEVVPGQEEIAAKSFGGEYKFLPVITSDKVILSEQILNAATAVNANSEHIEDAVKLIERIQKDSELYNTLLYGIENRHYKLTDSGQVRLLKDSGYGSGTAPALVPVVIGNEYQSYTIEGTKADIWKESQKWEDSAVQSEILGFNLKTNKINQEIADVTAVIDSELRLLDTGSVEVDEFLPQFLEKLEDAGSKRIIEECQKQLTQWNLKRSKNEQE